MAERQTAFTRSMGFRAHPYKYNENRILSASMVRERPLDTAPIRVVLGGEMGDMICCEAVAARDQRKR